MTGTRHRGFTLAEVLVASTISGFIAIVAVGAMNAVSHTSQVVSRFSEVNSEIRFASRMLAQDLANLYRDTDPQNVKLVGVSQGSETEGPPYLTFYTVGRAKARADQPEGDVYEVEYFLGSRQDVDDGRIGAAASSGESMTLFRRLWPNPDKDAQPGGILTPIADNIGIFYIRFYDGQEWRGEWTEEMRALPKLIEVTVGTAPPEDGKSDPVLEVFTVAFPRMAELANSALPGESQDGQQQNSTPESPNQQGNSQNDSSGNPNQNQGNQGR